MARRRFEADGGIGFVLVYVERSEGELVTHGPTDPRRNDFMHLGFEKWQGCSVARPVRRRHARCDVGPPMPWRGHSSTLGEWSIIFALSPMFDLGANL
jgi:hypothetical protein